jgi:hypothetical protein
MKTFVGAVAVVLVCLAGVVQADVVAGNLLTNGDFNTDLSAWVNTGGCSWTSDTPDGGGMLITGPNHEPYQDMMGVSLQAGQIYRVSFDAASTDASATGDEALVERLWWIQGSSWGFLDGSHLIASAAKVNAGWATYLLDYTVPTGHDGAYLEMTLDTVAGAPEGQHIWVDNVSITLVPEPCALYLVGSGAISLVAYAWRKRR